MKKILTHLTGIVFLITILIAVGCENGKKQNDSANEKTPLVKAVDNSTTVRVYLKDIEIDGIMHLEMYDSKKPGCEVVDNLVTVVNPGDTVIFYNAHKSDIKNVTEIRLLKPGFAISSESFKPDSGLYVLIIDPQAPDSTIVKYEIDFTVKKDTDTTTIDPYLKIPKQL